MLRCGTPNSWYRGFEGEIVPTKPGKYAVRGTLEEVDEHTIRITELPVRHWTQSYKDWLEKDMLYPTDKKDNKLPPKIDSYKEHHTDTTVSFTIEMTPAQFAANAAVGLEKVFKIESSLSTTNMVLFDSEGRIKKYGSACEILEDFYVVRKRLYQQRKQALANDLTADYTKLNAKVRFITMVIKGEMKISNRPKKDIFAELREKKFPPIPKGKKNGEQPVALVEGQEQLEEGGAKDYDYLLGMPMWSLTMEKVKKLIGERDECEAELNILLAKTPEDLWREDLDQVSIQLDLMDEMAMAQEEESAKIASKAKRAAVGKGRKKKKGEDDEWAPKTSKAARKPRTDIAGSVAEPRALVRPPSSPAGQVLPKAKVAKKSAVQRKVAPVKKPAFVESEESEEEEPMSLMDRIKAKPAAKAAAPKKPASKKVIMLSDSEASEAEFVPSEDSEEEFVVKSAPVKKAKKAPAKKAPAKKAVNTDSDAFDFSGMDEPKKKPGPKSKTTAAKPKKSAAKPRKPAAKPKKKVVDSESEYEEEEIGEEEFTAPGEAAV